MYFLLAGSPNCPRPANPSILPNETKIGDVISRRRSPEEFRIKALNQVAEKGKLVADAVQRMAISTHSPPYKIKLHSKIQEQGLKDDDSNPSGTSFSLNSSV